MSREELEFWAFAWTLFAICGGAIGAVAAMVFAHSQWVLLRMVRDGSRVPPPYPIPPYMGGPPA